MGSSEKLVDIAWSVTSVLLLLICGPGLMFLSAAYLTPLALGVANCAPHSAAEQVIEFVLLFGGLGVGSAVALGILGVVSRRYISLPTHQRWVAQFHQGASKLPYLNRKMGYLVLKIMSPTAAHAHALQQGAAAEPNASRRSVG